MNGFINIDKVSGKSSGFVVNRLKWLTGTPCGHMGTLDPLASGVLPVGVGKASRLFDYFLSKRKVYRATFTFGLTTDTLDTEGTTTDTTDRIPTKEEILSALPSLVGEIDQIPPKYSAKSIGGRRGYELARAGIDFELPSKRVLIEKIDLIGGEGDKYDFEITCGGGTYIRSIARDLGTATGSLAIMSALRRTQSGIFTAETALNLDDLTKENVENYLIPTDSVLPFPSFHPEGEEKRKLLNGLKLKTNLSEGNYKLYIDDLFYGIYAVENGVGFIKTKLC